MSTMKALKPVFLKTYGKDTRKLPTWLSPENRKQAFDTTRSTDGDGSVYEPAKPARRREKRTTVARRRTGRPAKREAVLCLAEKSCDEETPASPSCPPPAQQRKTTRVKKASVADSRPSRLAKRKAVLWLSDASSDEENISRPSPPGPPPAQQSKTTSGHLRSSSRFVTQRRRAAACKPKLPKATFNTLNSSDDFTTRAFVPRRTLRAVRTRVPPSFVLSSAENSVNAAGTAGFDTNPFREISLNESMDHSLGPCPRKPIFCSTPSTGSFGRRPRLKPLSISNQSLAPPSTSVSCIGVVSPFQDDVESSGSPVSPTHASPPIGLHSEEKPQSSNGDQDPDLHHHKEPSDDLFVEPKRTNTRRSCREEGISHHEDMESKNVGELASLYLLSPDDSESSSRFVSAAAGGLEWLIEALKEKCLTGRCTVQLERLGSLAESQLCSHSTYSSCLGLSSSAGHKDEPPLSVDSCQTIEHSCDYFHLVKSSESSEHVASVTESQSTNAQHSATQESMEQSASVLLVESTRHKDDSAEFLLDTQLAACWPINHSSVQTLLAVALKDECLTNKCTVQLKEMALTQQKSENDQRERVVASVNSSSLGAQTLLSRPGKKGKAAALATTLKEKCLSDKVSVEIKRLTFSQPKDILQLKSTELNTATDSASDDQSRHGHQPESAAHHGDKDTSVMNVNVRKRGSASFEDNLAPDKEEVKNVPHKRKKTLAPKDKKRRKSTPKDRSGTTRKASVSGLSTSRWKNSAGGSMHMARSRTKTVDCSINELIPTQHRQPWVPLGSTVNFSTPLRASRLNLSSLLADLTPNTHTWSRLKAALSVHRKSRARLTPGRCHQPVSVTPGKAELADVSQDLFATPFRSALPKRLRSQLQSRDSPVVYEDADLSDAEKVCAECSQPRPLPWEACILPGRMKQCVKIGEGTFGEVFSTTNAAGDTVALKVIPVEGSEKVNGEDQKTFGEILHEIIISKELSSLKDEQQNKTHGFIGLNDLHCVQGYYPPDFLDAWDTFDQQKGSENDRPDFFGKDQLFLILEFEFGGSDLENSNGTLTSLLVAKSILHQVTAAMAVAEQELHFEHRDLHWGNVLVKTTKQKTASFLLNGAVHSLETKGVLVRIIDYSLSRLEIDDLTVSCDISNDEELFMGQGDYQFDIYRLMREENGNDWSDYHPRTNVLWLHYLCSKLLSMKYRGPGGRAAKGTREELARFRDNVLGYSSATEALQTCPMFQ